jgi:hypothetical protein
MRRRFEEFLVCAILKSKRQRVAFWCRDQDKSWTEGQQERFDAAPAGRNGEQRGNQQRQQSRHLDRRRRKIYWVASDVAAVDLAHFAEVFRSAPENQ